MLYDPFATRRLRVLCSAVENAADCAPVGASRTEVGQRRGVDCLQARKGIEAWFEEDAVMAAFGAMSS